MENFVGQVLGHYTILRQIGAGGMSKVFLAQDIHLQREVAIKVFHPGRADNSSFMQRFIREARLVAQLDHPNILPAHDYGEEGENAYLVMPYITGGSLKDALKSRRIFPVREAIHLITQILDALQYAHQKGLIHRDIKPGNILFKDEGTPLLADFGLAKAVQADLAEDHPSITQSKDAILGTPYYMAPEQIQGRPVPASDIYSLGIVLYEMLTGTIPFRSDNTLGVLVMHLHELPQPPSELNAAIPPQLERVMLRALEKDPTQRYRSPADFRYDLLQATMTGNDLWQEDTFRTTHLERYQDPKVTETPVSHPGDLLSRSTITPSTLVQRPKLRSTRYRVGRPLLISLVVLGLIALLVPGIFFTFPVFSQYSIRIDRTGSSSNTNTSDIPIVSRLPEQPACPQADSARAANLSDFNTRVAGHNVVVYAANRASGSVLKRYDVVTKKSEAILSVPNALIDFAQLSSKGQWTLFVSRMNGEGKSLSKIQIVRLDGQGLQTLYCTSSFQIQDLLWSLSGSSLVFNATRNDQMTDLYLLNLSTGSLERKLSAPHHYKPILWSGSLYLVNESLGLPSTPYTLYSLNILTDGELHETYLHPEYNRGTSCSDFDLSTDGRTTYASTCTGTNVRCDSCVSTGPSYLNIHEWRDDKPALDNTLLLSNTLAVTHVRAVTSQTLLLTIENTDVYGGQNGLWKINSDGTNLRQVVGEDQFQKVFFNSVSQFPWSNVSRDGTTYAVRMASLQAMGYDALVIGNLNSGASLTIETSPKGQGAVQLVVAGWAVM